MRKFPKEFCEQVGHALDAAIERVCRHLLPNGTEERAPHTWVVGNVQGGAGTSLRVHLEGAHQGSWKDFASGEGGGSIKLWMANRGIDYHAAIAEAAAFLDLSLPAPMSSRGGGRIVAVYDYVNLDGTLAHQTVRFEPKDFRQRIPSKAGEQRGGKWAREDRATGKWWIWGLTGTGVEPVLYHLPDLAKRPSDPVFICEGEKDADRLAGAGALTTTCPMGAKKWRDSYSQALAGRRVIICPDRDAAGMEHLCTVAARLAAVKADVRMLDWARVLPEVPSLPPEGKADVADLCAHWTAAGMELAALPARIESWSASVPGVAVDGRPELILPGTDQTEWRDFYRDLGRLLRPRPLFRRGGQVLTLNERQQLEPVRAVVFRSWVQDHVALRRWRGKGEDAELGPAQLIKDQAEMILESPQFQAELRPIRRVHQVPMPIMRLDGSVELLQPGYDDESQILTTPGVDFDREVPLDEARRGLDELLADFTFDPEDAPRARSVVIASMLSVFGDCLLPPSTQRPVFVNSANTEGGGKTLCVRLAICPVHGALQISPPPRKEGDLQKVLLPVVLSGRPYLVLDNWRGLIGDPALEAFVTATVYGDRVLGQSRDSFSEKQCLVFITANQAILNGDMRRRSLVADLFVEEARAEEKQVRVRLDEDIILGRRGQILSWLWAVVRDWAEDGCPEGSLAHGTFLEWGRMVGGMMERAGWLNPCGKPKRELDENLESMTRLVLALAPTPDSGEFEARLQPHDLLTKARELGCFDWFLEAQESESEREQRSERKKFADQLKRFDGRVFGGWRIRAEGKGHNRIYRLTMRN